MTTTHHFSVVSNFDLTTLAPEIAAELARSINTRFISGQSEAVGALADSALATVASTTNEVQSVTISATGGTFTLTFDSQETGALDFDFTSAEIETALAALSTIGAGNVSVTGDGPHYVQFVGTLAATDVSALVSDPALLTGGAGTATVATVVAGGTVAA